MGLLTHYSDLIEAGCDEAGRGCLAGPVVAAAVILKKDSDFPELNDSKQLTEKKTDAVARIGDEGSLDLRHRDSHGPGD